ncbi:MAG: hypothetical protein U0P46_11380 [Holophagaceae bacterium]
MRRRVWWLRSCRSCGGILSSPADAMKGQLKSQGKVTSTDEILALLKG